MKSFETLVRIVLPLVLLCVTARLGLANNRPKTSLELLNAGATALADGRANEAIEFLTQALKEDVSGEEKWRIYMDRALAYGLKDEQDAALGDFGKSLASNPPNSAAVKLLFMRGILQVQRCNLESALDDLNRAVEMGPSDPEALVAQGGVLLTRFGNYRQWIDNFDRALDISRQQRSEQGTKSLNYVLWKRAELLIRMGQYRAASTDLETVFKSSSRSGPPCHAYIERARVELMQRDFSAAQSDCEQALKLDSNNLYARALLGQVAWCQGRTKAAKDVFRSLSNCVYRVQLQFSEGKTEASLHELGQNLPKEQCEPLEMVQTYGVLLHTLGETNQAVAYLRRAVRESGIPNLSWAVLRLATRRHEQRDAVDTEIESKLAAFPKTLWAVDLIKAAVGEQSLEDTLKHARAEEEGTRDEHAGEAYYVAGELKLLNGDKKSAQECFESCTKSCLPCSLAHVLAIERLRQLRGAAPGT